ncbi:hypothetical protein P3W45_001349 [Vairimorpha bombi]
MDTWTALTEFETGDISLVKRFGDVTLLLVRENVCQHVTDRLLDAFKSIQYCDDEKKFKEFIIAKKVVLLDEPKRLSGMLKKFIPLTQACKISRMNKVLISRKSYIWKSFSSSKKKSIFSLLKNKVTNPIGLNNELSERNKIGESSRLRWTYSPLEHRKIVFHKYWKEINRIMAIVATADLLSMMIKNSVHENELSLMRSYFEEQLEAYKASNKKLLQRIEKIIGGKKESVDCDVLYHRSLYYLVSSLGIFDLRHGDEETGIPSSNSFNKFLRQVTSAVKETGNFILKNWKKKPTRAPKKSLGKTQIEEQANRYSPFLVEFEGQNDCKNLQSEKKLIIREDPTIEKIAMKGKKAKDCKYKLIVAYGLPDVEYTNREVWASLLGIEEKFIPLIKDIKDTGRVFLIKDDMCVQAVQALYTVSSNVRVLLAAEEVARYISSNREKLLMIVNDLIPILKKYVPVDKAIKVSQNEFFFDDVSYNDLKNGVKGYNSATNEQ